MARATKKQNQGTPPKTGDGAFLLRFQSAAALALSSARVENGVPVRRYRKELIRCGHYVKASAGLAFDVTPEMLDHWALSFSRWTSAGNKVPIPPSHEAVNDADRNLGWAVDIFREGESLIGILELIGPDAAKLALANDVSIYVPETFTDGTGQKYEWPITHVALTPNPLIPGLQGFEEIAASLSPISETENPMIEELAKLLGLEVTPETAQEKILAAVKVLQEAAGKAKEVAAAAEGDKGLTEEEQKKKEETAIAASHNPLLGPMVKMALNNRKLQLDNLVTNSKITPAVRTKLAAQYCDEKTLSLSLSSGREDGFDALVNALAENNPVELAEKTGAQVIALSHGTPANQDKSLVDQANKEFERTKQTNPNVMRRL